MTLVEALTPAQRAALQKPGCFQVAAALATGPATFEQLMFMSKRTGKDLWAVLNCLVECDLVSRDGAWWRSTVTSTALTRTGPAPQPDSELLQRALKAEQAYAELLQAVRTIMRHAAAGGGASPESLLD